MTYKGRVKDGVVVFDDRVRLPEGTEVEVTLPDDPDGSGLSLYERLEPVIGRAQGLPPDASENIDHYLYGHPKR